MVEVWLPYGTSEVCLTVQPENLIGTLNSNAIPPPSAREEIEKALENPLGTGKLRETAKPNLKVAIALDGSLKPSLANIAVSHLCSELNKAEIENRNITFILGCKPDGSPSENGTQYVFPENVQVKIHNSKKAENLVEIGTTSFKTKVFLNKDFFEADVKILLGGIQPNPYAGYSGGRMTLFSIVGVTTIHHNYSLIFHPNSRLGVLLGNQVHLDMTEAAGLANINFTLNLALDDKDELLRAFSGSLNEAFDEGVKFLEANLGVNIKEKADIVVVSPGGAFHDSTFYSSLESLGRVAKMVKEGGSIVLVAECLDGMGAQKFSRHMMELKSSDDVKELLKKQFTYGVHSVWQFMEITHRFRVILVSTLPETAATKILKLKQAKAVDDAVETAFRIVGRKSKIFIVPYAMKFIPLIT